MRTRSGEGRSVTGAAVWLKRPLDVVVALAGLVVLAPLLLLIAVAVVMTSGWPPLFTQIRVGRHGRPFTLYKFRTMIVGAETMGAGLYFDADDRRFTGVGRLLRRSSLDELPQLWNVLIGDESLVGPRAMVPPIADKLTSEQNRRHGVRPGITGWAQINGRNEIPWSKRVELDIWYVDHWSLWLDLRILGRTIPVVFSSDGVLLTGTADDVDDLQASGSSR
jgi:lipopolysaccharide/colanic/teichoic acid biosynthesis glycosyltransferase